MGWLRKISERDGCAVIRALESPDARGVNGTIKNVVKESGPSTNVFSLPQRERLRVFRSQKEGSSLRKRPKQTPEIRPSNET